MSPSDPSQQRILFSPPPVHASGGDRGSSDWKHLRFFRAVLMVGLLLGTIAWTIPQLFFGGTTIAPDEITVQTDGNLTRDQILELGRIPASSERIKIDPERIENHLSNWDFIRSARVEQTLSGGLDIHVSERVPVAALGSTTAEPHSPLRKNSDFLIDGEGFPIRRDTLRTDQPPLPVVRELSSSLIQPGLPLTSRPLLAALRFLEEWSIQGNEFVIPTEIHLTDAFSFHVRFEDDMIATFGVRKLEQQISDLRLILNQATASNQSIATVNLLMARNIPITFSPENQPPSKLRSVAGMK